MGHVSDESEEVVEDGFLDLVISEPTRDYWVGSDTICNNPRKALATSALIRQRTSQVTIRVPCSC